MNLDLTLFSPDLLEQKRWQIQDIFSSSDRIDRTAPFDTRMADTLHITVEFSGGLEMLFENKTKHKLQLASKKHDRTPVNVAFLVQYLCDNVMRDTRKELFVLNGSIKPGILVLINDADWELDGEEMYELVNGDNILFVSTLHGG